MNSRMHDKRRSNILLAAVLGLVAVGFYVGFILVTAAG